MACGKYKIKNLKKPYVDAEEYMETHRPKDKQMINHFLDRYKKKEKGLSGVIF